MGRTKCLYPGSFDPVTNGHLDIITRASGLFDEVVVAVLRHIGKQGAFPVSERVALLKKACAALPNVRVIAFEGLTVDLARDMDIRVLIRGVRGASDVENEMTMARANRVLSPNLETLLIPAAPERETIRSSFVREIASFGGDIAPFVPASVLDDIRARFAARNA